MPYIDEFRKSISSLHSELSEKYSEIGKLDIQFQELQKQLETQYEQELEDAKKLFESGSTPETLQFSKRLTDSVEICKAIADQKISLATETYKRVDGHIRRLDKYLKKFDQGLKRESELIFPSIFESKFEVSDTVGKKSDISEIGADDKKLQVVENSVSMDLDLPIDPNEPTYCLCNRVSFGEMVACDNSNCKIEWFHYECVGITSRPKGKWYCPECVPNMKNRKRG